MKKTKIIVKLSDVLNKEKINEYSSAKNSVKDLIEISFYKDERIAFRASWILETICITDFERFLPQIHYFLDKFPQQNNLSCRRHYSKILALITKKNAPKAAKEIISKYNTDTLVETVFSWLIDEKVPVAVKSHCLNILANFNSKHSWIKDELIQTMDFLVDKESIAFYAKAKQIRRQLK